MTGAATAGLGQPWSHNHAAVLKQSGTPGAADGTARILLGDGSVRAFNWDAATAGWKPANSADTLIAHHAGLLYKRLDDDSQWQFDGAGRLLSVTRRNGRAITYSYSTTGLLIQVSNQFGRSLSFTYNATGQLATVTGPDGQVNSYGYDATGRLGTVTYPGAGTRTYLYENTTFPQLLTGIIDEAGNRLAAYAYDAQGRGISTQHAGGADLHSISYGTAGAATVTDPRGTQRTYRYTTGLPDRLNPFA